ncbi:hypothetical protein CAAN1_12S01750 [[Candida] anglica]|uniref:Uncharacterized protein n=1 Tax=[Candida] anglica TaxID=148631 RepID=A0ABP0E729_9ASCO
MRIARVFKGKFIASPFFLLSTKSGQIESTLPCDNVYAKCTYFSMNFPRVKNNVIM